MKKVFFFLLVFILAATGAIAQQKWSDLTKEDKLMKLQSFRDDNQAYLKDKLGMSKDQLDDIDNVNICYLSTLDRINRYGKDDAAKEKYAKAVTQARSAQLEAIMGPEKRKKYAEYVTGKLKKASENIK